MELKVTVNGVPYHISVEVEEEEKVAPTIIIGGAGGMNTPMASTASVRATSANAVVAPLSGSVSKVLVEEGQTITEGEVLVVLEAMKMENVIKAPGDATVKKIHVQERTAVEKGQLLLNFE